MNELKEKGLRDLYQTCVDAVQYVGSANYTSRERAALRAVSESFNAFSSERWEDVRQNINEVSRKLEEDE
jgi:S-adenosylmethionine:diacylglycerol 3-amino-3-carboxypropyl transferase